VSNVPENRRRVKESSGSGRACLRDPLGWTALIESILLGERAARHSEALQALVEAGAEVNLPDRSGRTPLSLARARGYEAIAALLRQAGGREGPD
jgi:ankyrin repeat protein